MRVHTSICTLQLQYLPLFCIEKSFTLSLPVDCAWLPWSDYGECSQDCGGGLQYRSREKLGERYGGRSCEGKAVESQACNTHPCPSKRLRNRGGKED